MLETEGLDSFVDQQRAAATRDASQPELRVISAGAGSAGGGGSAALTGKLPGSFLPDPSAAAAAAAGERPHCHLCLAPPNPTPLAKTPRWVSLSCLAH